MQRLQNHLWPRSASALRVNRYLHLNNNNNSKAQKSPSDSWIEYEICRGPFLALEFFSLLCPHVTQQPKLTRLHNEDYKFVQDRGSEPKPLRAHHALAYWALVFNSYTFVLQARKGRKSYFILPDGLKGTLFLLGNQGYLKCPQWFQRRVSSGWRQRKFRNCIYFVSTMSYSESHKT